MDFAYNSTTDTKMADHYKLHVDIMYLFTGYGDGSKFIVLETATISRGKAFIPY